MIPGQHIWYTTLLEKSRTPFLLTAVDESTGVILIVGELLLQEPHYFFLFSK